MSKMVNFEIQNFMSIGYAKFDFDESGVINIVGYNDSGKSAVTKALEVLLYDAYEMLQVKFIRDDCSSFAIGAEFDDGVAINKYKYLEGRSVWEMFRGEELVYTNKLDGGVVAISGVPEPIAKYLGVVEDENTGEKVNIRRNTDKLFLIDTTGGDNYKIINSVLRCDIMTEAGMRLNKDRNRLQTELVTKTNRRDTLKTELDAIDLVDEHTLSALADKAEKMTLTKDRLVYLSSIGDKVNNLNSIHVYEELPTVDTSRLTDLVGLASLMETVHEPVHQQLPLIDTERIAMLQQLGTYVNTLAVPDIPLLPVVDGSRLTDVRSAGEAYNAFYSASTSLATVEAEHQKILAELKQLSDEYGFKICNGCGTVVA